MDEARGGAQEELNRRGHERPNKGSKLVWSALPKLARSVSEVWLGARDSPCSDAVTQALIQSASTSVVKVFGTEGVVGVPPTGGTIKPSVGVHLGGTKPSSHDM